MKILIKNLSEETNYCIWVRVISEEFDEYNELIKWIEDNFEFGTYVHQPIISTDGGLHHDTFLFYQNDAVAFKIRWM